MPDTTFHLWSFSTLSGCISGFPSATGTSKVCSLNVEFIFLNETVRCWELKFRQAYARRLRTTRPRPDARWHLDEVFVSVAGKRIYLWRAVNGEGEVLDILVRSRRNKKAALKMMRRLLKKQGFVPLSSSQANYQLTVLL